MHGEELGSTEPGQRSSWLRSGGRSVGRSFGRLVLRMRSVRVLLVDMCMAQAGTGRDRTPTEEEQQQICAKRATRHVEFKDDPNQFNVDVERE